MPKFEREVEIDAPVEKVWQVMTDPKYLDQWFPGVDSVKFAQGISTALYATLLGLLVAIPALIAWSYYSKKVENLTVEMETLCDEFLRRHYKIK